MCATHLLESTGHCAEADNAIKRALADDPLSVPLNTELGCNAYYQHRYDEAIRGYREALILDSGNVVAYWGLGRTLNQQKKLRRGARRTRQGWRGGRRTAAHRLGNRLRLCGGRTNG